LLNEWQVQRRVVRPPFTAVALLCAAFLAGCDGGNGNGDEPAWTGPPEPAADGSVSIEEFAAYQADVDERWERAAETAAAEFVRVDETDAARLTIARSATGEGEGPQTVLVTLDGLFDDSVRAERWTLLFEPDGETFTLSDARWSQRCQPGRGHQAFTPAPCN
jgi:hypothetical protein